MINLMLGDSLERMKEIPDGSVDLILTDPPYGTTACKWDSVIPFEPMWEQLNRIVKPIPNKQIGNELLDSWNYFVPKKEQNNSNYLTTHYQI